MLSIQTGLLVALHSGVYPWNRGSSFPSKAQAWVAGVGVGEMEVFIQRDEVVWKDWLVQPRAQVPDTLLLSSLYNSSVGHIDLALCDHFHDSFSW